MGVRGVVAHRQKFVDLGGVEDVVVRNLFLSHFRISFVTLTSCATIELYFFISLLVSFLETIPFPFLFTSAQAHLIK